MSKVIAVFGAGTGLGVSVARRFGREGFRVALVARREGRLDALAAQLADEDIEAAAFAADLAEPAQVPALVAAIRDRFGRIDVVEYGPVPAGQGFTSATRLDAATLEALIPLFLLTPVEVVQAVLPEMTERGDGAFLLTQGFSAVLPSPHFSGPGPVMAAARNYLYSLNGELAGTGVYAGTLAIAAAVARSENAPAKPDAAAFEGIEFPVVDPDDIAECYWDMYTRRDHVEQVYPEFMTPQAETA
ncbi:short-subunit dehydrogenase [Streptosporangium album]|uniref:Short-subunit dehydrogenase n=1 Tax=Streptosporangium album TaxID=47479 RepID=A0A7W7W8H5_9ACTN|nr:SDR family NAD(P)-dependent oxidoreductase [Streptosporangium album]MBB4937816.1 short-subunit dehydrogenase [Streptosporangium album]